MLSHAQLALFGERLKPHKLPQTQYLGSKQKLATWIYKCSPKNIETFFDAFSGTSSVAYYFKAQGKRVIANDFLKFNYHIAKSLIENTNISLTEEDISSLFQKNKKADSFIEKVFTGVFFERDQAQCLDNFRANVERLESECQNHYGGKGSRKGTKEHLFLGYE